MKLKEIVIYKGKSQNCRLPNLVDRTHCTSRLVTKLTNTGVGPKDTLSWSKQGMPVPAIAPTMKNSIIESYYELHFKVNNFNITHL